MNKFLLWIQMGEHGIYIWSAYAICFAILVTYYFIIAKQNYIKILKDIPNKQ